MAAANKRQTGKTSSGRTRASSAGKGRRKSQKADPISGFTNEVILVIILAIAILLLVSNFGAGGAAGEMISDFCFGVFGLLSYIFPFLLFIGVAFFMSNKRNPLAYKKMIAGVFFYIFLCALMQLLTEGYMNSGFFEYFQSSAKYHTGGGIVGGTVCKLCATGFGVIGAYIWIICGLIISLIFVTQRSFFGFLRSCCSGIKSMIHGMKERHEESKPEREARAQAKAAEKAAKAVGRADERAQKKVSGGNEVRKGASVKSGRRKPADIDSEGFLDGTRLTLPDDETGEPEEPEQMEFVIQRSSEENADSKNAEDAIVNETEQSDVTEELEIPEAAVEPAQTKKTRSPQSEIHSGIENIKKEIGTQAGAKKKAYQFPPLSLLKKGSSKGGGDSDAHLRETAKKLKDTLHNFGVNVTITNISCGPTVTRYELQPEQGVKVSKIVSLTDDIKLNLATSDIRIEAPIPGKAAVGIEVPNEENSAVMLRDLLQSREFKDAKSKLAFAAGKDIGGKAVVTDIGKMPHLLIAGATGSGKSVCINTLIMSVLYKASPDEVKLIMIDPKVVELSVYNGIPHLLIPVVTDPKKAAGALNWAVAEMTDRYNTFAEYNVRNLQDYNKKINEMTFGEDETRPVDMPQIVIIVDELADLMMVAPGEVEDAICRLAQLARAAGIHLVIATQRPSVNVITGLIKANMPSRIAFSVSSGVDSRTILDMNGAEKLLGKGDMLFYPQGYQKPARLQGAYVSDQEVSAVVEFLSKKNPETEYNTEVEQKINTSGFTNGAGSGSGSDDLDTYFIDAGKFIIEKDKASIGMLQRMFKIGFNRAARIMDQLSDAGVVGPEEGTKPRKVLMSMEEFENYIEESL